MSYVALSFALMSFGSVILDCDAACFSSSPALLWSSTMRAPNFFTDAAVPFCCASCPILTSAMPPAAAFLANVVSLAPDVAAGGAASWCASTAQHPTNVNRVVTAATYDALIQGLFQFQFKFQLRMTVSVAHSEELPRG